MTKRLRYFAGVDIGSVSIKAALVASQELVAAEFIPSRGNYREGARQVLNGVLSKVDLNIDDLAGIVVTGLGMENIPIVARQVSDISCQIMGCRRLFPSARTVIDIGGQFTKVARMAPQGHMEDFLISEKCAAGSGRFLQVIARILQVDLEDMGSLSLKSETPVEFSTNCAVFAESETISRIAEGARAEDILAGVHRAMAAKVTMLVKRIKMEPDVVLTGGGGEDAGLIKAIGDALSMKILVPENPRLTAAFGAACLAEVDSAGC
ncbi:MAG: 2-hydroxyisocaproyl-CoA dehydratase activator [Syntrophus sp. SKADARSKE-3]|nr:2-hydroxyisocaproyl-CoA dehydratase activator [Syntrophus sp. SKADARSKE-3]